MTNPMIGMPQGAEWLVILAIVVLVFGAAKLPDLARGTGQALRIFKAETKGLKDEDEESSDADKTDAQRELEARQADVESGQDELDSEAERMRRGDTA
jgi:sec-independent protein translocase protein TatA